MKIKVFKSGEFLKEYEITKDKFILGRTESSDICIQEESVSRKHIEFNVKNDDILEFSKKAKFAMITKNGEDMEKGELQDGEKVSIGDITVVFEAKELVKEDKKPKSGSNDFDFFTMSAESEDLKVADQSVLEIPEDKPINADKKIEKKEATSVGEKEKTVDKQIKQQKEDFAPSPDATVVGPAYLLYQLIAISGPHKDKTFLLDKNIMIAGRGKNAGISLVDDLVSREHSRFYRQGVDYYVVDLDSSNGTKVNGKKIMSPTLLTSGDIVEIGASILRFIVTNPQVQNVHGVQELTSYREPGQAAVEKVTPLPSETEVRRIEKSYGFEEEEQQAPKKNILFPAVLIMALFATGVVLFIGGKKTQKPLLTTNNNVAVNNNLVPALEQIEQQGIQEEQIPEIKCEEQGSFCQQPLAVQKQLLSEYDVAVRLLKNYQFELAEDRAQQILSKVPDWNKAKEVLDVASAEKEKLLAQKKEEEDAAIRRDLETKVAVYLRDAESLMKKEKYEQVKELISKIFELDPNNQSAKDIVDRIDGISSKRAKLADDRAKYLVTLSKYEKVLAEGKKYYSSKEYRRSIETFQKCISFPVIDTDKVVEIRSECQRLSNTAATLLKEAVTPELSGAMEAYTNGRYKESIEAYNRVIRMDYKNKEAKEGIVKSKEALEEEAREIFSRAAIAESVSDYATACPLYNRVLEISIPGSKYYENAAVKAKSRCGTKL